MRIAFDGARGHDGYNPASLGVSPEEMRCKSRTLGRHRSCLSSEPGWARLRTQVEKDVILTPDGYEKLKQQIDELETIKRREVADRIREAREFGDITENSEYDDAKNEQALLEHRIARLKEQLRSARVIDTKDVGTDVVVGRHRRCKVKDVDDGDIDTYEIVGSAEADPAASRLSNESPVGRALLGHKKGETVEVAVPAGAIRLKIMEIKAVLRRRPLRCRGRRRSEAEIRADRLAKVEACAESGVDPVPGPRRRIAAECGDVRDRFGELEAGRRDRRARSGWPAGSPAAAATARRCSSTWPTAAGGCSCTPPSTCSARSGFDALSGLATWATWSPSTARCSARRRGELSPARARVDAAGQVPAAAAREAPRADRRRAALPAALPRPAGPTTSRARSRSRSPARRSTAIRARARRPTASSRSRRPVLQPIYGGGAARPFTTFYNALERDFYLRIADRAVPEAADRRRPRARLRDRQGLPQRGRQLQAQPRVHDARVVRGLRRLRERHGADRAAGRRRGGRGRRALRST